MITLLVLSLVAGEIAVLTSGFELTIDRHEERGSELLLISGAGATAVPRSAVVRFEALPAAPVQAIELAAKPESAIPIPAPEPAPRELVRAAAERHGLPSEFVEAVARAESSLNPNAVSPKGAIGLMQLMPQTAAGLGADPHDPSQNADTGAKILRELLFQYQNYPNQLRRALAAYNAGSGAVAKYDGVPPYRETQTYVERVLADYLKRSKPAAPTQ